MDHGGGWSFCQDLSTQASGSRSEIDHMIGFPDYFRMVFYQDHGVAFIPKGFDLVHQLGDLGGKQPRCRFIQDIGNAGETGSTLLGQFQPLEDTP